MPTVLAEVVVPRNLWASPEDVASTDLSGADLKVPSANPPQEFPDVSAAESEINIPNM